MKKLLIFAAVATLFAACSKDATKDLAITKPIDKFYVTLADEDASRVQLDADCKTVWTEGDSVSIFNKTTGNECWGFNGATGDTKGELTKVSGDAGEPIDKVFALYPYNAENTIANGVIGTVIPATQKYMKGSFGEGGNIMVATSDNTDLSFKHLFGWIRIALTGDKSIKSITLQGYGSEPIAGKATIGDDLGVTLGSDAGTSVTLDCGEGVQLSAEPTYFYIAVAPQTFSKGIYVEIVDADNNIATLSTAKSITVERNHIVPMKASECTPLTAPLANQIWYTTSNGATITPKDYYGHIVSNTYSGDRGVITFDCARKTIAEQAFKNCETLTGITIPNGVTSIETDAFQYCGKLETVVIPDSVTKIGNDAFLYCTTLPQITIPDSAVSIGRGAFSRCYALKSIAIPDNVTKIEMSTFYQCKKLTEVKLPKNLTAINDIAFRYCSALAEITIPDSVTSIASDAFMNCPAMKRFCGKFASADHRCLIIDGVMYSFAPAELTTYAIPTDAGITAIGEGAFYQCNNLTSVTVTDAVESLGKYAFFMCEKLNAVTLPSGLKSLGYGAFFGCSALENITIPAGVATIGGEAFGSCTALKSITIPEGVASIGDMAFHDCTALSSITLPKGLTTIGYSILKNCTCDVYVDCNLPNGANDQGVFTECKSKKVVINEGVTTIGDCAFAGSACQNVAIAESVTTICDKAFYKCTALEDIVIPDGIVSLGKHAFAEARTLKTITIGKGVKSVGWEAFLNCLALQSVYISDLAAWCAITFADTASSPISNDIKLYINGTLTTDIVIPESVTEIGGFAFYNYRAMTSLKLGSNVTRIGEDAFGYCPKPTTLIIPEGVDYIGGGAFAGWEGLTTLTIPKSVRIIGGSAFTACKGLTSVYLPEGIKVLSSNVFSNCTKLTSFTIPASVTEISYQAFMQCNALKEIYCKPTTPPTVGSLAFSYIAADAKIYVPRESVEAYKAEASWTKYKFTSLITGYDF